MTMEQQREYLEAVRKEVTSHTARMALRYIEREMHDMYYRLRDSVPRPVTTARPTEQQSYDAGKRQTALGTIGGD